MGVPFLIDYRVRSTRVLASVDKNTYYVQMWSFGAQKDLFDRLEQLESRPHPSDIRAELDTAQEVIVALRSLQDAQIVQLDLFETKLKDLTLAVAEGIENVARKERRIASTLARARKELAERGLEAEGIDAEIRELSDVDGAGSEEPRLPAVPSEVAVDEPEVSSIEGVPLYVMRAVRGLS